MEVRWSSCESEPRLQSGGHSGTVPIQSHNSATEVYFQYNARHISPRNMNILRDTTIQKRSRVRWDPFATSISPALSVNRGICPAAHPHKRHNSRPPQTRRILGMNSTFNIREQTTKCISTFDGNSALVALAWTCCFCARSLFSTWRGPAWESAYLELVGWTSHSCRFGEVKCPFSPRRMS